MLQSQTALLSALWSFLNWKMSSHKTRRNGSGKQSRVFSTENPC